MFATPATKTRVQVADRTNRHYSVSLWDSEKFDGTPAQAVAAAGFSYAYFHPRPVTDQCFFYHVSGPSDVPEWMRPCKIPPYILSDVERRLTQKERDS